MLFLMGEDDKTGFGFNCQEVGGGIQVSALFVKYSGAKLETRKWWNFGILQTDSNVTTFSV